FNSIFEKTAEFLEKFRTHMNDIKILLLDYTNLIKESMDIYIDENKKIFSGNLNINFETIKNFYDSLSKESLDANFNVGNIIRDEDGIKQFNDLLTCYQTDLLKFNIVKNEEVIYNDQNFQIQKYKTMDEFID